MLSQNQTRTLLNLIDQYFWYGSGHMLKNDGTLYQPNPGQKKFHASRVPYKAFIGGRGSGKTAAGAEESLIKIRAGRSGAVYNPDFENFKDSTWPEFRRWIPWRHVIPEDRRMGEYGWEPWRPFVLHFDNGAAVRCKGLKNPDSARGPNINWLWYDEAGRDRTGESWLTAIGSVRIPPDPSAFITTTPKGKYHWIYDKFVAGEVPPEVQEILKELGHSGKIYEYYSGSIKDNMSNLDPLWYAAMLTSYTGQFAKQELHGEFIDTAEGLVYEEISLKPWPEGNIWDGDPDPDKPIELAIDEGYIDPRVILFIQKTPDAIFIFDEIYHVRHLPEVCVGEAVARCNSWPWASDDNLRDKLIEEVRDGKRRLLPEIAVTPHDAPGLKKRLRSADIPARGSKAEKIIEGIKTVRGLILDGNGVRVLKIHPRCDNLINELTQGYRYPDSSSRKNNENPEDANNHGPDAFRIWTDIRL